MTHAIAAVVERVIDGDTLVVRLRVRTVTNAPELGARGGDAARTALASRLPSGTAVWLEPHAIDIYNRMVAVVTPQGRGAIGGRV